MIAAATTEFHGRRRELLAAFDWADELCIKERIPYSN